MDAKLKVMFYLKKNETKTDGTAPIMGRIYIGKSMVPFSTKTRVTVSLWDIRSRRATGKSNIATTLNRELDRINVLINNRYKELQTRKMDITPIDVRNVYQGIALEQDKLINYFTQHNIEFEKRVGVNREYSTFKKYRSSLDHLKKFILKKYKISDISFKSLTYSFIEAYDFYLRIELKLKSGTILNIMRQFRKMIKLAINKGAITHDPFTRYSPERPKPEQKYLTRIELNKIMNTPLNTPNLYLVRDMFLLSCFTGLAYQDICNLTENNIVKAEDGVLWIKTERQKTGTICHIPLLELPIKIMSKYKGLGVNSKFLPILSNSRMNANLKIVAKICGIEKNIIFHMARHVSSCFSLQIS